MKLLKDFITIMIIEIVYSFFSLHVNLCYGMHKKIRSIIYSYWLINDKTRFIKFIGFNFLNINMNHVYILNKLVYVGNKDFLIICYEKDYDFTKNKKILSKLRYCFYYLFMYMFMDDINNINGINSKVIYNKRYIKEINKRKFNKFKIIKSVFTEDYWNSNSVSFNIRKYFIDRTYTYNYLRDIAISKVSIGNEYLGFKYDYDFKTYIFTLNKTQYLRRQ